MKRLKTNSAKRMGSKHGSVVLSTKFKLEASSLCGSVKFDAKFMGKCCFSLNINCMKVPKLISLEKKENKMKEPGRCTQ